MDRLRIDDVARLMGGATSRRGALRLIAAAAVGTALGIPRARDAAAVCRPEGSPCRRPDQCCSGACRGRDGAKTCRSTRYQGICTIDSGSSQQCDDGSQPDNCLCEITLRGTAFCAENGIFYLPDGAACTSDAQCREATGNETSVCFRDPGAGRAGCGYPCENPASGTA